MKNIRIENQSGLRFNVVRASGGNLVGICQSLAITVQSETWVSLLEDIAQTLNLLFADLLEDGELDEFLRDRGFRLLDALPAKPDDAWFDIPFSPTMTAERDSPATFS